MVGGNCIKFVWYIATPWGNCVCPTQIFIFATFQIFSLSKEANSNVCTVMPKWYQKCPWNSQDMLYIKQTQIILPIHTCQEVHSIHQEFIPLCIMCTNCSGTKKPVKWWCRNHQRHDRLPLDQTTLSVQSLWVRSAGSHLLFPSRPAPLLQRTMNDLITCRLQYLYHQTKAASNIQVSYSSGNLWLE